MPRNSLIAEALHLAQYMDRVGAGKGDMMDRCRQAGLAEPEFTQTDGFVVTIRRKARQIVPRGSFDEDEASGLPRAPQ